MNEQTTAPQNSSHGPHGIPETLRIYVQLEGVAKPHLVELPSSSRISDLLEPLAQQGVHVGDDLVLFVEDEELELPRDGCFSDHGVKHRGHVHYHRCRKVKVRVSLNGHIEHRDFPPSARIGTVRTWAAAAFAKAGFEGTDEMALEISGTTDRPLDDAHVGTLVIYPDCCVAFNLIGKPLVQG